LLAVLACTMAIVAKDKQPRAHPEHGTVVAVRSGEFPVNVPVHTDPNGKTWGGWTARRGTQTYRIAAETLIYEVAEQEKHPRLSVGDKVDFRIEKGKAFLQEGDNKERKYKVVATEMKK